MFLIIPIIVAIGAIVTLRFGRVLVARLPEKRRMGGSLAAVAMVTGAYWLWESQAEGNIRVDLLLIYPLLFAAYVFFLWGRIKWLSVPAAFALMAVNFGFFAMSYEWFGKYPG
jgi:hypothetical protein